MLVLVLVGRNICLLALLLVELVLKLLLLVLICHRLSNCRSGFHEALQSPRLLLRCLLKVVLGGLLHLNLLLGSSYFVEKLVQRGLIVLHVLWFEAGVRRGLLQVVNHHHFFVRLENWLFEFSLLGVKHLSRNLLLLLSRCLGLLYV